MLIVVIGMDTFIIQPAFVQGLVEHAGFSDRQAGLVASAEMFGIAATTILMTWLTARVRWRILGWYGLAGSAVMNAFSILAVGWQSFAVSRFACGLASGVLISLGYAVVGLTSKPDRNFGLLITFVLVYGALGILVLPSVFARIGLNGVLICLALLALFGTFVVRALPAALVAQSETQRDAGRSVSLGANVLVLGALFCFFLAQGAVWAYLFLIGIAGGGTTQSVANGLTIAQFFGIAGALTGATVGSRLRHSTSFAVGVLGGIVPMLLFPLGVGAVVFGAAVSIFNFAANYVTPLLMAIVTTFDRSGRLVVIAVALQMLGLAIGPALGALAIRPGDYHAAVGLSIGLCIACLSLGLPAVLARGRQARAVSDL